MAIDSIWFNDIYGSAGDSVSGTLSINFPGPTNVCASLALTRVVNYDDFSYSQLYFIGYSDNGNPVPVAGSPNWIILYNCTSLTAQVDILQGAMSGMMSVFTF